MIIVAKSQSQAEVRPSFLPFHRPISENILIMADSEQANETKAEIPILHNCLKCKFSSITKIRLSRHKKTHEDNKQFKCKQCDYASSESGNLKRHRENHHENKPLVKVEIDVKKLKYCFNCDFSDVSPSHLKRHEMTHTGEMPHKCSLCDYASAQSSNLKRHIYDMHTENKPMKPKREYKNWIQCLKCDYSATAISKLKRHDMTHTGEVPNRCNQCGFAAAQEGNLKRHLETHEENRVKKIDPNPNYCLKCPYSTSSVSKLVKHLMTHTGDKPHKCDLCDYASYHPGNLKRHIVNNHSKIRPAPRKNPVKCHLCSFDGWKLNRHMKTHVKVEILKIKSEMKKEVKKEESADQEVFKEEPKEEKKFSL